MRFWVTPTKRKYGSKALPALRAAGLLSLAGAGASASSVGYAVNIPTSSTGPNHEIALAEEGITDVTLATSSTARRALQIRPGLKVIMLSGGGKRRARFSADTQAFLAV
jgi:hypothetical protein